MSWNWEAVQGIFMVFVIPILVGIAATWLLAKLVGRLKPKAKIEDPRKKTFLEEALEADADRPRWAKAYTWDEFQKDLHDGTMTFEEIYEKYGGVFPKKPEPSKEGSGDPQAVQGLQGADGGPGIEGAADLDRMAQLQQWFQARGRDVPLKGLVKPPPSPYPVIYKIYTRGRR